MGGGRTGSGKADSATQLAEEEKCEKLLKECGAEERTEQTATATAEQRKLERRLSNKYRVRG